MPGPGEIRMTVFGKKITSAELLLLQIALLAFGQQASADSTWIDPAFTAGERAAITRALAHIPSCRHHALKNLRFLKDKRAKGRTCDQASHYLDTITLGAPCAFATPVLVHEIFHHLQDHTEMYRTWQREVLGRHPRCPVSDYGAEHPDEDFAEAGRLLLLPGSQDRRPGKCVDEKVAVMRQVIGC